jgi:hypothetical protein
MSDEKKLFSGDFVDNLFSSRMTRRSMVRRTAALGVAVPAVSALLAACEVDDDVVDDDAVVPDVDDDDDEDPAVEPVDDDDDDDEVVDVEDDDDEEVVDVDDDDDDVAEVDPDHESVFGDDYESPEHVGGQLVHGSFSDAPTLNAVLSSDTTSAYVISLITKGLITNHP